MLTISQPLSSAQAQKYHAEEFTSRSQAYYAEGEQVRGEWQGRLAEQLGLGGEVRDDHFARLSEGRHPWTGEQLVQQRAAHSVRAEDGSTVKTMGHRAGWDATFSAPKSVSLTALVGNDQRVRDAHRHAVTVAIGAVEDFVQARLGGDRPPETTRNWAVAKFEHDTSRPVGGYPAPQLHTHAVFFNVTRTEGGDYRAMQPRQVYRSQQYGTAVYRAELASRLRGLGYDIQVEKNGTPEVKGYSREYLEANSLRSRQIREHLEAGGYSGAAAAQIAAHRTRESKASLSRDAVRQQHRDVARQFGNEPEKVVQEARSRGERQAHDAVQHAGRAVTYARDRAFEREAVVDRRDLMKDALRRACGHATFDQVRRTFDERVRGGEFIRADRQTAPSVSQRFTTLAMIANEHRNIEFMRNGQAKHEPLVASRFREGVGRSSPLSQGQRAAVNEILSSRDRVVGFQGIAGSGKTTTLREVRIAAQRDGYQVRGLAPTSRATAQLQDAGIRSTTLQRHLAAPREASHGKRLYVLDESSLASTKQAREFFERMGPKDRAVLVGDSRQHQAVDAGRPFQQLQQTGMRTAKLDEAVRQQDPGLKQVVHDLARGRTQEAFTQLREWGRVHEVPERQERLSAIAREVSKSERTLVIAPDNRTRQDLNERIRHELKERGHVTGPDQRVQVLTQRQDMTGADRAWAAQYRPGDVVRYTKGSAQHQIKPGDYATVRAVDAGQNTLRVETRDSRQVDYDPKRLRGVSVYERTERAFAVGDRVQMTAPDRSSGFANRELARVELIDASGDLHLRSDSGRSAVIRGDNKHVDHGYAVTSHSAQGATADRVIVHAEGNQSAALVNQRFAYVAGSRMREGLEIYTDDARRLESSVARHFDKTAAVQGPHVRDSAHSREVGVERSTAHGGAQSTGARQELGQAP